ncbi:MAG: exonuclease SbcCD subunit D [Dehalococcoidales bacterium]|nr:exonuclease SbcCD subunit D [Dehalococcoidales bacterium]
MKIIHFADLHLGVESYGHIDPNTGLSSRLNDFLLAFDRLIDFALEHKVDLILFCGDAYKSREPTQTQQREFARRISRLSSGGIPVFLLIGNHDLPNAIGRATSTEIFDTLAVRNIYVASRPDIYPVPTQSGTVQVAALPWLRRSALLSREDTRDLDFEEINQRLQQVLTNIIGDLVARLDARLPAILTAHVWVANAVPGSERSMTLGQEHFLLLSNIANPAFDYVALGHVHKQQVLSESPPTVYAGSMERLDFGEEGDDKGFYVVDIDDGDAGGRRRVSYRFHPLDGRRFLTINVNLGHTDTDPTATVVREIMARAEKVRDAIVRLQLSLPAETEGQLNDIEIRSALNEAHYFTIAKDIKRETRLRLGKWTAEEISPVEALKVYLESKKVSPTRTRTLLEYGERLIRGEGAGNETDV